MNMVMDSSFSAAVSLCEAVLSGEASKQVLDAAKAALCALPFATREIAVKTAVSRGKPTFNHGPHHDMPRIPCALGNL